MEILTSNNSYEWNKILSRFPEADIYYDLDYIKALEKNNDGIGCLFYYSDELIEAINVVIKREISINQNFSDFFQNQFFDIITPYGYGGFLIKGSINDSSIEKLNQEYIKLCQRENIITEFARFHPLLKNYCYLDKLYDIKCLGNTVQIDLINKGDLWTNYSSKNRNVIRKAQKNGINVNFGVNEQLLNKFIELYEKTMDRNHASSHYYFSEEYYQSYLKDLKNKFLFFYSEFDQEIISMSIIFITGENLHYHLSASNSDFSSMGGTNLMISSISEWGIAQKKKKFHLGGGLGSQKDSLYKFKKAFNKNEDLPYYIGTKIFNDIIYNELLLKTGTHTLQSNFFPKYRTGK